MRISSMSLKGIVVQKVFFTLSVLMTRQWRTTNFPGDWTNFNSEKKWFFCSNDCAEKVEQLKYISLKLSECFMIWNLVVIWHANKILVVWQRIKQTVPIEGYVLCFYCYMGITHRRKLVIRMCGFTTSLLFL